MEPVMTNKWDLIPPEISGAGPNFPLETGKRSREPGSGSPPSGFPLGIVWLKPHGRRINSSGI